MFWIFSPEISGLRQGIYYSFKHRAYFTLYVKRTFKTCFNVQYVQYLYHICLSLVRQIRRGESLGQSSAISYRLREHLLLKGSSQKIGISLNYIYVYVSLFRRFSSKLDL